MRSNFVSLLSLAFAPVNSFLAPRRFLQHTALSVKVGDQIADVTLFEGKPDYEKAEEVNLKELCEGRTVVIFAVPGAFTPGCSKSHLPSYIEAKDALKAKGVDEIVCTATNDPYVMEAWGADQEASGIRMLSDKEAKLCRALGVAKESDVAVRSQRYALVVKNGVVSHYFPATTPEGEPFSSNTYAPSVLEVL